MFNFFKPSVEPYKNIINLILYSWNPNFPLCTNDQKFAILTALVKLAQVDGPPSKNKVIFMEVMYSNGRDGIWGIDKEKHPIWQLPNQFPFSWVKKHLQSLQPNNRGKFFMLAHTLTNVVGNQSFMENMYIMKLVEEMGSTHEEYLAIVSKKEESFIKLKKKNWM